jgi:hypothetical protein
MTATLLRGAAAGLSATVPMTTLMSGWRRLRPDAIPELPPRTITARAADAVAEVPPEKTLDGLTGIAHLAFGAAAGAVFAAANPRAPLAGPAYGAAVWAVSYLGWLPALRLMPPPSQTSRELRTMMLVAHLVWGWSLARSLRQRERDTDAALSEVDQDNA